MLALEFNENLESIHLTHKSGWARCGNRVTRPNREQKKGPEPISIAALLLDLENIGFYRICTLDRLLGEELFNRRELRNRWVAGIAYQAGRLGLLPAEIFQKASLMFTCPRLSKEQPLNFDFLQKLFIEQLKRLHDSLQASAITLQ